MSYRCGADANRIFVCMLFRRSGMALFQPSRGKMFCTLVSSILVHFAAMLEECLSCNAGANLTPPPSLPQPPQKPHSVFDCRGLRKALCQPGRPSQSW